MNRKGSTHYNTLAAISDTHTITDPITIQNNDRKPFQIENRMRDSFCIIVYRIGNIYGLLRCIYKSVSKECILISMI